MHYIKETNHLNELCSKLNKSEFLSIDTEFIREKTYWPKLCLIQVFNGEEKIIIDPLAKDIDLKSFFEILNNKEIVKIFHSGRQDIEIFYNLTKKIPQNIYDTQIAAMVCGFGDSIGYENLVSQLLGKKIDKTSRLTNWSNRPLSKKQINYAISDVTHLFEIYPIIRDKIISNKRENWLKEEIKILISKKTYELNPNDSWKRLKYRNLSKNSIGVLIELSKWREIKAQKKDVPRGNVIRDDAIYELCSAQPKNIEDLNNLRSFNRKGGLRKEFAEEILLAIEKGKSIKKEKLPKIKPPKRLPMGISSKVSILKILLDNISEEYGVAQKLIANKNDLQELVLNDKADIKTLKGWRYKVFGKKAIDFKNGKISIKMKNDKVILEEEK
ncbi:MAG: ribonuclease D [Pseudomonadota bacterium]|jgi:ribonuclease D|nr:ribonuclease D [Rhodobiaceae bacterium]MEC9074725.1 ribonuclease D [Pseudomonadota bacterium]MEC9097850.1 ribonuclease D [Pseudomonadota bacterium]MED5254450.1 ribonuclease D [Pseudomonadota bacterium]MED5484965.1 ribonuclease D [Pseudomonadota bacterium]|tara:strand:+ start:355 stop:1509 length:1155 start_codon:yes stop_codon:yes gene_type:complete